MRLRCEHVSRRRRPKQSDENELFFLAPSFEWHMLTANCVDLDERESLTRKSTLILDTSPLFCCPSNRVAGLH